MNKVILIGRLARDPRIKTVGNDNKMVTFTVAAQRNFKNKDGEYDADFINCRAWGKTAELISKYFTKGKMIGLEGSWRHDSWQDAGEWHNMDYLNVSSFEFIGSDKEEEEEPQGKLRQQGLFEADDETALPFDF